MDGLEVRKTGRGSDGLVRGREYRCPTRRDQWEGHMKTKEDSEGNGQYRSKGASQSTRKVQDEEEEGRGVDEC